MRSSLKASERRYTLGLADCSRHGRRPRKSRSKIFEIVNQLDRGTALIHSPEERERVAELNLIAGKRAKTSTAYASALTYLVAGRALLPEDSWEQRYALTFGLEFHQAECEFLIGDFAAAEERLSVLSRRAGNLVDSAAVARLQTELYSALDQSDRAVEAALEYLRRVGIDWSPHPTKRRGTAGIRADFATAREPIDRGAC